MILKRKVISFLISSLLILNITPVFAATAKDSGKTVISLNNIKEIMLNHSIQLQIVENNYKKIRQSYSKLQDEIDDIESDIDALNKPTDKTAEDYETKLADYNSKYKSLKSQLDSKEQEEEIYKQYTLKNAKITYDTAVQSKVYEAQKAYLEYLYKLQNIDLNDDSAASDAKDSQIAKNKYEYGFISKNEYDNTVIEKNGNTNNYELYKKEADQSLNNLYYLLGITDKSSVVIENDVEELFKDIISINYSQDFEEMLSNNYNIKSKKLEIDKIDIEEDYDDADDDDYKYDEDNADLNVEAAQIEAELGFKKAYDTLITSYNSLKTSYDKLNQSKKSYDLDKQKNLNGFVSNNELAKTKHDLDSQTAAFVNDRNTVYTNYLNYLQMKEGY